MPPRPCIVCSHPKRDEINKALLSGEHSDRAVAKMFQVTPGCIHRHRANHLILRRDAVSERANVLTIVGYASDLYERASRVLDAAEAILRAQPDSTRGVTAAAQALRETRSSIELLARLIVEETPGTASDVNAALDARISEALDALVMPALPSSRPALEPEVADAVIIETA